MSAEPGNVEKAFQAWLALVFPEATEEQEHALRCAWFSSGTWLMAFFMTQFSEEEEPTEEDMAAMEAIDAELNAYAGAMLTAAGVRTQ